jgi:hypothetical protein
MSNTRAPPTNISRGQSDVSGMPMRERVHNPRHPYGDEMYDNPRSSIDLNGHMDAMYGNANIQGMASSQVLPSSYPPPPTLKTSFFAQ